jgi:hypothetical protein
MNTMTTNGINCDPSLQFLAHHLCCGSREFINGSLLILELRALTQTSLS